MMSRALFSAALLLITVLSLAPQALVCGTAEKHKCTCCTDAQNCSCCTMAPLYPDQAAASPEASRVSPPEAWMPVSELHSAPVGSALTIGLFVETVHGPPPLQQTSQLRI